MSHLVVGLGVLVSDDLPFWSPSLLLYKDLEVPVGDLRSVLGDCDGGLTGFDVEERSSMLLGSQSASVAPYPEAVAEEKKSSGWGRCDDGGWERGREGAAESVCSRFCESEAELAELRDAVARDASRAALEVCCKPRGLQRQPRNYVWFRCDPRRRITANSERRINAIRAPR